MKSLTELYKIGRGPSSSHTMGPEKAAKLFMERNKSAYSFKVVLYGSLAKTGKGHGTDVVLKKTFTKPVDVVFDYENEHLPHPNTMDLFALDLNGKITDRGECTASEEVRSRLREKVPSIRPKSIRITLSSKSERIATSKKLPFPNTSYASRAHKSASICKPFGKP